MILNKILLLVSGVFFLFDNSGFPRKMSLPVINEYLFIFSQGKVSIKPSSDMTNLVFKNNQPTNISFINTCIKVQYLEGSIFNVTFPPEAIF